MIGHGDIGRFIDKVPRVRAWAQGLRGIGRQPIDEARNSLAVRRIVLPIIVSLRRHGQEQQRKNGEAVNTASQHRCR